MRLLAGILVLLLAAANPPAARADMGPPQVEIDPTRVPQVQRVGAGVCLALAVVALGVVAVRNWRAGLAFSLLVLVGVCLTWAGIYLGWVVFAAVFAGYILLPFVAVIACAVYLAVRFLRKARAGVTEWLAFAGIAVLLGGSGWLMAGAVETIPKYGPPGSRSPFTYRVPA